MKLVAAAVTALLLAGCGAGSTPQLASTVKAPPCATQPPYTHTPGRLDAQPLRPC